jgi:hypothetical protein
MGYLEAVRPTNLQRLGDVAQDQWGLVTRRQAAHAGVSSTTLERLTAPSGSLERVAFGVYRLAGAPVPDHQDLRAAWLQLAPDTPAWQRTATQGVVSHRSAATFCGLGHLTADVHEFTVSSRKQTRRQDVRLHIRAVEDSEWIMLRGLPVTRPSRTAADLLQQHEDPEAVAQIVAEAIRGVFEYPGTFAEVLGAHASRFGFRRGDGIAVLSWLLTLAGQPDAERWIHEARQELSSITRTNEPDVS